MSDIPDNFSVPGHPDAQRRSETIRMRDGIELHAEILIPKGAKNAPMLLEFTPYGAAKVSRLSSAPQAAMQLYPYHAELLAAGYILVLMDVRGKFQSLGRYAMNLPLQGPLNPGEADYSTDTWDSIDWLCQNVAESNGRVGTIGISYDGYAALMSLIDPHPALKACVPINPMVDGWRGDDWFHNGAFRPQLTASYSYAQTASKNSSLPFPEPCYDDYDTFLQAGSSGELGRQLGLDKLPFWQRLCAHPAYDEFWQAQAVDKLLGAQGNQVPTLLVHSQWDPDDIYGAMAVHAQLNTTPNSREQTHLVIGPWGHVGPCFDDGYQLGAISFGSDTARHFRQHMLLPFLDQHLREKTGRLPQISAFESGSNRWQELANWPPEGVQPRAWYLQSDFQLDEQAPSDDSGDDSGQDCYYADPARPLTHLPRPIRPRSTPGSGWESCLIQDQRFISGRPDLLVYTSSVFESALHLAGEPVMNLYAATEASDVDWIIKLIDVYPAQYPAKPELGGYQLPLASGILRARYREDFSQPSAVPTEETLLYSFKLPHISHALQPGHRLMLQIQSSSFPMYDRNPQTYVDNMFEAKPEDYRAAWHTVCRNSKAPSHIVLPVIHAQDLPA